VGTSTGGVLPVDGGNSDVRSHIQRGRTGRVIEEWSDGEAPEPTGKLKLLYDSLKTLNLIMIKSYVILQNITPERPQTERKLLLDTTNFFMLLNSC